MSHVQNVLFLYVNSVAKKNAKKEEEQRQTAQTGLADLSNIDVPYPTVGKPDMLKEGAQTVPRPSSASLQSEPFYHQYDSRTLPTLPRGRSGDSSRSYAYLERGASVDDQTIGTEPMKTGTISTSSSFETVRSEHVYETAYAMQQLHKQYMESLRRQRSQDGGIANGGVSPGGSSGAVGAGLAGNAIPEELTASQIVAIHQAAKDLPKTSQPVDVQVHQQ